MAFYLTFFVFAIERSTPNVQLSTLKQELSVLER